jgi:hypothetical protein
LPENEIESNARSAREISTWNVVWRFRRRMLAGVDGIGGRKQIDGYQVRNRAGGNINSDARCWVPFLATREGGRWKINITMDSHFEGNKDYKSNKSRGVKETIRRAKINRVSRGESILDYFY